MKRSLLVLLAAVAVLASACGASGDESAEEEESTSQSEDTGSGSGGDGTFGSMDSPCGPDLDGVTVTVDAADAGKGTDKLYVGVANERTAEVRPGLLQEMWDSTVAFVNWCNDQGGIGGLPLEAVDIDGKLLQVEAAMTTACSQTFAMVGGGYVQDNQVFTGKDGSDFHKCGMIAFPGFAVSTEFAEANGVVQPLPNPAYLKPVTWLKDIAALHPEEVKATTVVYGEGVPSIRINKDQNKAAAEAAGGYTFLDDVSYALLNQDFSVTAQKVIDLGATALNFVGEPENFSKLMAELDTKGWEGIAFADANQYDERLFASGPSEGVIVRQAIHIFEEADDWPATRQFLDIIEEFGPDGAKVAALGVQSFSAGLLFATAANECARSNDGVLTRDCVIRAGLDISEWDGGGLHVVADPSQQSTASLPACSMLVQAEAGETFGRLFPELGGDDDNGEGFHCLDGGWVEIEGDFGTGNVDPSRGY